MKITRKKRLLASFISWLPVISLACAVFVFNTSEFIPIGLLNAIATDFAMSEAAAGMMITIYAWVVALASLPLMLYFSQVELKRLMLCVMGVFVLSHIFSALASSYITLVASRVGVALSHALFWSVVSPMAVRAAPRGKRSAALGLVVTGSSLALIAGLPIGRVVGLHFEWRATFALIGVIAFCILLLFAKVFPAMPSSQNISLKTLPKLISNKIFSRICVLTLILVSAHFTAYSYIEPFLARAGVSQSAITWVLLFFGSSGILASVAFARFYERLGAKFVNFSILGVIFSLFAFHAASVNLALVAILCVFWGFCMVCFNISFQSQIISAVPNATAVAMSIFSGIYNIGIGGGAFIGGVVMQDFGAIFGAIFGGDSSSAVMQNSGSIFSGDSGGAAMQNSGVVFDNTSTQNSGSVFGGSSVATSGGSGVVFDNTSIQNSGSIFDGSSVASNNGSGVVFVGYIGGILALCGGIYYIRKMSFIRAIKLRKLKKTRNLRHLRGKSF